MEAIIILLLCLIIVSAAIIILLVHVVNAITDFKQEVRGKFNSIEDYEDRLETNFKYFKNDFHNSVHELSKKVETKRFFLSKAEKKSYKKLKKALDNTTSEEVLI